MAGKRTPAGAPPALPPRSEPEQRFTRQLLELAGRARQENLDLAVLLAQQAARGQGPLVDHFAELGRLFGDTLNAPPQKPALRLVQGGE